MIPYPSAAHYGTCPFIPVKRISFVLLLATVSLPAAAYIGPGSGISLLGGLWAVLVGIVLALAAILFWPIRYMIKRRRAGRNAGQAEPSSEQAAPVSDDESDK